jgi:hypothetical protein
MALPRMALPRVRPMADRIRIARAARIARIARIERIARIALPRRAPRMPGLIRVARAILIIIILRKSLPLRMFSSSLTVHTYPLTYRPTPITKLPGDPRRPFTAA